MANTNMLHCNECNHEWEFRLRLPMPLDRAITAMRGYAAAGCPNCGAFGDAVLVGPATPQKETPK